MTAARDPASDGERPGVRPARSPGAHEHKARGGRDEGDERDPAPALRQEERGEEREEHRRRVDGEHRHRDRRELDRLEEEVPVHGEHDADRDEQARAASGTRRRSVRPTTAHATVTVTAAIATRQNTSTVAERSTCATITEISPQEAARAATYRFQRTYIRSGAPTPTRSRQRAVTARVASQRPSRKASASPPSTLWSW